MESIRGILRAVSQPADGEASATVQLVGVGSLDTFVDGVGVSHGLPAGQLVPGADIVVHLADRHHPGDGQIVAIVGVTSSGGGGANATQSGTVPVMTDQNGTGAVGVVFGTGVLGCAERERCGGSVRVTAGDHSGDGDYARGLHDRCLKCRVAERNSHGLMVG